MAAGMYWHDYWMIFMYIVTYSTGCPQGWLSACKQVYTVLLKLLGMLLAYIAWPDVVIFTGMCVTIKIMIRTSNQPPKKAIAFSGSRALLRIK